PSASSAAEPASFTRTGVFHDPRIPLVFHTSVPDFLSRATTEPDSTLALTMSRSLWRIGEAPLPQPCVPLPTLVCQSCLPSRSKAKTPALPKKTKTCLPSDTGVAGGCQCMEM